MIVAVVTALEAGRQLFGIVGERMHVRLVRRLPVAAREPEGIAVAHRDLDVIGRGKQALRVLLREQRRPGLFEPFLHAGFERLDHRLFLVEVVRLDAGLGRLFGNRVQDQFEFARTRGDGLFNRLEDMRRRELIHRNRQARFGLAEKGLELAPAGFRADADRQLHRLLHQRKIGRIGLFVAAALGRGEIHRRIAAQHFLERTRGRSGGRAERDRLAVRGRHLFLDGGFRHRERDAKFGLQVGLFHRCGPGRDRHDDGGHRRSIGRIFETRPDNDDVVDVGQLDANLADRLQDRRECNPHRVGQLGNI